MAEIEKRESETEAPLVTFALFAYNQEQYIREAIEGAFSQDYENLEIILSDDCSRDKTFKIMEECVAAYSGAHRVRIRRNAENIGVALHFDTLMREARGDLVVVAAGDDVSAPSRTQAIVDAYAENKNATVIESACNNFKVELDSGDFNLCDAGLNNFSLEDVLLARSPTLIGAGRCYVRSPYLKFRPLFQECPEEDTPALFRALYCGEGVYLNKCLVNRRIHDNNLSAIDSLMKMKFESLREQYFEDLKAAFSMGEIGNLDFDKYSGLLSSYINGKQLRVEFHSGFKMGMGFIDIVRSRSLGVRDKLSYLKKWFLGFFIDFS